MTENKRFQKKRLDKENNKQIKEAANGIKGAVTVVGTLIIGLAVLKHRKDIFKG